MSKCSAEVGVIYVAKSDTLKEVIYCLKQMGVLFVWVVKVTSVSNGSNSGEKVNTSLKGILLHDENLYTKWYYT